MKSVKSIIKKALALTLCCTAALSLSACGGNNSTDESVTLNVYNWGDYIDESVLETFTEETGIKVNYEMFATNEDMYIKIKNGGTDYDIAIPSDYMIEKMAKENLLQKIDTSKMENYKNIGDFFKNLSYDPNNEYSVPYMWGTVGILYNKTKVDAPITSWKSLWDEKYKGQIFMYNSQRDSIGVALKMLGYSINTRDLNELSAAKQALVDQMPLVLSYAGDDVKDKMIAGEAALSVMYSGDAMYVKGQNEDLEYVVPEEGSNYWFDGIVIPKTSTHKEEAEKFIDFLCRPDIALKNTEYIGYSTPNSGALELLDDEIKNDPTYTPSSDVLPKCELFYDLGDFIKEYDKAWTEILAS